MSELQHLDTFVPEPPRSGGAGQSGGAPPSGPPVVNDGVDDAHLLDYVKVLYMRRWTAGTVFLIIFLGVLVYTFTVTPRYEARTRLLIERQRTVDSGARLKPGGVESAASDSRVFCFNVIALHGRGFWLTGDRRAHPQIAS